MKKKEAEKLAPQKINLIIEYITQILEDTSKVSGMMRFSSAKINSQNMCTIDMYVLNKNFEKHLNLDITSDHQDVLRKEFLNRVITDFLPHDTIGATRFYRLCSNTLLFEGISIINSIGSEIKMNMFGTDKEIINEYNAKYDEFISNNMLSDSHSRIRH